MIRQDSQEGQVDKFSLRVVFSFLCQEGNIKIKHKINFSVEPIIIKTVHAFFIMFQKHDPEGDLHLLIVVVCFCLLFVSAVHFAPYLMFLSSMMLIQAAGARC